MNMFKSTKKMWTIIFKSREYCPQFLEISMNIRVYPENVDDFN